MPPLTNLENIKPDIEVSLEHGRRLYSRMSELVNRVIAHEEADMSLRTSVFEYTDGGGEGSTLALMVDGWDPDEEDYLLSQVFIEATENGELFVSKGEGSSVLRPGLDYDFDQMRLNANKSLDLLK